MRGVVFTEHGQDRLEIRDDVEVLPPGPGEIRVRIHAAGVCHSDYSTWQGTMALPAPGILGHEGAGEVTEVGDGVTSVAVGDRIIVSWVPPCGACPACRRGEPHLCRTHLMKAGISEGRFLVGGVPHFGMAGIGTFAEEVVLPAYAAVPLDDDVPYEIGALIGCGVTTGFGAVVNVARVRPGDSVAVIGCGGVGIAAIQAARISGAAVVAAIDTVPHKLAWARDFGATHAVGPGDLADLRAVVATDEGFDHVVEAVGLSATIRQAYDLTRRGGQTIVIGAGRFDDAVAFNAFELFFNDKAIKGSWFGGADVRRDYPKLQALWRAGRLDLEGMITARRPLEEVNEAF
ncbi:MAG TPA: Zn-dependent alcohol dehydrogenase, partial [Nitriliruptorales bacterium]